MFTPVDLHGVMTEEAQQYARMRYSEANDLIISDLRERGALFASHEIVHSYPHCWRCKNPVIFRATEQWFASVEAMKQTAIKACGDIRWFPEWGKDRMIAMLDERSDWCISRQRHWGLPIPVFYCRECEKPVCTPDTIDAVAKLFAKSGSNTWYELTPGDILPDGFSCPHCGGGTFSKGSDSLDCWFDSGSTHAFVLNKNHFPCLSFPSDLYLEGGDQYRGWFQSSMLTSIATNGIAPYRIIITHGWTVDGQGKAMHKSLGNAVAPEEIIKDYGADLLRLWVASTDYKVDSRISKEILKQLSDIYLKIRNTARFILGNLDGFDPDGLVHVKDMPELDRWALSRLNRLVCAVLSSYEKFEYHTIYHAVHNFCTVDMSNFYLDVIKDRLYCDKTDGLSRRSAQTVIYTILDALVRMLAPILAFTAEEIWAAMPHHQGTDLGSVLFNNMPEICADYALTPGRQAVWDKLLSLRVDVNKALELARADKVIGKPLDAEVCLYVSDEVSDSFKELLGHDLKSLFIVSAVNVMSGSAEGYVGTEFPGVSILVKPSSKPKCARCWIHDMDVGKCADHPELCPRCCAACEPHDVSGKT